MPVVRRGYDDRLHGLVVEQFPEVLICSRLSARGFDAFREPRSRNAQYALTVIIGILIVIVGFAIRMNPLAVVTVAGIATACRHSCMSARRMTPVAEITTERVL